MDDDKRFARSPAYFFLFNVSTVTVVLTVLSLTTCIVSFVTTFEVSVVLTSSVVLLLPPVQEAKATAMIAVAKNDFFILMFISVKVIFSIYIADCRNDALLNNMR